MKLQVNISNELNNKIEKYAKEIGISKSSLCAAWIYDKISEYEKSESEKMKGKK